MCSIEHSLIYTYLTKNILLQKLMLDFLDSVTSFFLSYAPASSSMVSDLLYNFRIYFTTSGSTLQLPDHGVHLKESDTMKKLFRMAYQEHYASFPLKIKNIHKFEFHRSLQIQSFRYNIVEQSLGSLHVMCTFSVNWMKFLTLIFGLWCGN